MTWMFQRSRHLLTCELSLLVTWSLALFGEKNFDTQDGVGLIYMILVASDSTANFRLTEAQN